MSALSYPSGPQPMTHEERLALAREIAAKFHAKFGDGVYAIGIYGSLARGTDGPYSDIEIHCVLRGEGVDTSYEWSAGPWKAEVDVYSPDVLLAQAAELDEFWSLTHGAFTHILPLYDPEDFFPRLKEKVFDHRDDEFNELVISIIVGEQMEFIGKIRNALACGSTSNLAALAVEMTKYGAYIVGLAHRHLYTSSSVMFTESLSLPNRPQGYDALCKMVTSGGLSDPAEIARAADSFWEGIEAWAQEKGLAIHKNIDELLA